MAASIAGQPKITLMGQRKSMSAGKVKRGWLTSLGTALAIVGVGVALSAVVNPLLGRYVHWDWMAAVAPTALVLLTIALRRRWV